MLLCNMENIISHQAGSNQFTILNIAIVPSNMRASFVKCAIMDTLVSLKMVADMIAVWPVSVIHILLTVTPTMESAGIVHIILLVCIPIESAHTFVPSIHLAIYVECFLKNGEQFDIEAKRCIKFLK